MANIWKRRKGTRYRVVFCWHNAEFYRKSPTTTGENLVGPGITSVTPRVFYSFSGVFGVI